MSNNFMHVDPQKQREFIENLNKRLYHIEQIIGLLESRLRLLGRDWRDDQYQAFESQTNKTKVVLRNFIEEGRRVSKQLAQAADLGEKYQNIKL